MKIILIRHGETKDNKARIVQGQTHGELNEEGIIQAEKLSERLKNEKIDAIFSSDLKRAHDTAIIISKYHKNIPFIIDKYLRERSHGTREGKKGDDLDWTIDSKNFGGESREDVNKRAKNILYKVYKEYKDKNVVFVSHGGIGKSFIIEVTGKKASEIEVFKNTSVTIIQIKEDKNHIIHLMNCTKHLEEI